MMSQLQTRRNAFHPRPQRLPSLTPALERRGKDVDTSSRRKRCKDDIKDEHGLTAAQLQAFQDIFHLYDINGGGTIDADKLDAVLRTVNINLKKAEILDILLVIDKAGSGEIDFEGFLKLIMSAEKILENVQGGSSTGKEDSTILFSALHKFMKKSALSSLSDMERYFVIKDRKAPHILRHYTAGARLMGLSEKQLTRRQLATLRSVKETENYDSPYAQPLFWICKSARSRKPFSKQKETGKIRLNIITGKHLGSETFQEISTESSHCSGSKHKLNRPKPPPLMFKTTTVPLPTISLKGIQKRRNSSFLTVEQLAQIRSKVRTADEHYYRRRDTLKMEVAKTCNFTDISAIKSRRLRQQFKNTLKAYDFKPTNISPDF